MTEKTKPDPPTQSDGDYRFGIVFGGKYPNQEAADKALGDLEFTMVTEHGFTNVRGGGRLAEKPLCSCDSASECDERSGCVFTSSDDDDDV